MLNPPNLLVSCETQTPADFKGTSAMNKHSPINSRLVGGPAVSEPPAWPGRRIDSEEGRGESGPYVSSQLFRGLKFPQTLKGAFTRRRARSAFGPGVPEIMFVLKSAPATTRTQRRSFFSQRGICRVQHLLARKNLTAAWK